MVRFIIFLFIFSCSAWSKDLTNAYFKVKYAPGISDALFLQKYKVLIIPGVLAQSFLSHSNNAIKLSFLFEDGFSEQIALMKKLKIDYEFLNLETENPPEKNALGIIEAIQRSKKQVLIYSHSKGGLDTLEAIRQKPEILSKIHGWASIQSPFWGSFVASEFNNNKFLRDSGQSIFEWMGGNGKGMSSLSVEEREVYMDNADMRELLVFIDHKIHFINYASFKQDTFGIDTPLEIFRNFTDEKGGANDGVVPLKSALMKEHNININFIIEDEVDHLMTMTRYRLENVNYNQKAHTFAILKLLL